jgi:hypothetical protein
MCNTRANHHQNRPRRNLTSGIAADARRRRVPPAGAEESVGPGAVHPPPRRVGRPLAAAAAARGAPRQRHQRQQRQRRGAPADKQSVYTRLSPARARRWVAAAARGAPRQRQQRQRCGAPADKQAVNTRLSPARGWVAAAARGVPASSRGPAACIRPALVPGTIVALDLRRFPSLAIYLSSLSCLSCLLHRRQLPLRNEKENPR